ncbi:hypothetical protein [Tissierella praeacuta]|nr:hypothetical protein [Tissierella praeacuta]
MTLINDNVIKILDKYRIKITESIHGTKEIHDFNRIFKNGKGTMIL